MCITDEFTATSMRKISFFNGKVQAKNTAILEDFLPLGPVVLSWAL